MEATLKDYYRILGVEKNAGEKEIKTAYRKLARQHHPDTKVDKEKAAAEERIKEINEAYDVLGDKKKREEYDQLMEALKNPRRSARGGFAPGAGYQASPDGGYTFHWEGGDGMDGIDPSMFGDLFADLFGGGDGRGDFADFFKGAGTQRRTGGTRRSAWQEPFSGSGGSAGRQTRGRANTPQTGQDYESEVELSLEEAFRGGHRTLRFAMDPGGEAQGGHASGGTTRILEVNIPAGVREGSVIRLQGQGAPGWNGGASGDLRLTVRLRADTRCRLEGDDVEMELVLRPDQAALGCEVPVSTFDGKIRLTIPPMTRTGRKLRLQGRGWQRKQGGRGDLYVRIQIDLPAHLTEKEKQLYRQMAEERKA